MKTTKQPRPVKIELQQTAGGTKFWAVVYQGRVRGQRHLAACFEYATTTEAEVLAWVADNPRVVLKKD